MRPRQRIRKPKTVTKPGEWKTGKMGKQAFPMARGRHYVLGARWTWRVDVLASGETECRLLTAFEPSTEQFLSILTYRRGAVHVVVARLEYHGYEPGLHCHAACEPLSTVTGGVVKPYGTRRLPAHGSPHRRASYEMTQQSALQTAFRFFNVGAIPEGAMV